MSLYRIAPPTFRLLEQGTLGTAGGETRSLQPLAAPDVVLGVPGEQPRWRAGLDGSGGLAFSTGADPFQAAPSLVLGADSTLDVSGAAAFRGAVAVAGAAALASTLDVSGAAAFGGALDVSGAARVASSLDVSGAARVDGQLDVSGAARLTSSLHVSDAATLAGALHVSGAARMKGTLDVSGALRAEAALDVSGAARLGGTLDVSGALSAGASLDVSGAARVGASLDVSGALSAGASLDVSGAARLGETLDVSGALTAGASLDVAGALRAGASLDVSGALRAGASLDVSGAAALASTLDVSGAVRAGASLDVSGASALGGTLNVGGDARMASRLDVSGGCRVDGHVDISSGCVIKGSANFLNSVTIDGDLVVLGTQTTNNTQTLEVTDSILILNNGLETEPPPTLQSGIEINRGTFERYKFIFDELSLTFQVGISGELQPVATRELAPADGALAAWHEASSQFRTSAGLATDASDNLLVAGSVSVGVGGNQRALAPLEAAPADHGVAVWSAADAALVTDRGIRADGSTVAISKPLSGEQGLSLAGNADISGALAVASHVDVSGTLTALATLDVCGNARLFDSLRVENDINAGGNITAFTTSTFSDARLKTEVVDLFREVPEDALQHLRPVAYTNRRGDRKVGFVAQEVELVLPHVVEQDPHTGYLSLSYAEITALLAATVQGIEARLRRAEEALARNGIALPE